MPLAGLSMVQTVDCSANLQALVGGGGGDVIALQLTKNREEDKSAKKLVFRFSRCPAYVSP